MIIKETDTLFDERFLTAYGLIPDKTLFFDIETTGLKPAYSHLYLIGAAVKKACIPSENNGIGTWTILQYFAETSSEEKQLLSRFCDLAKDYDTLVQFNGCRFDIPYLNEKYEASGLPSPLNHMKTLDLYQEIRPLKGALNLQKLNQKSVEEFLGITRKDQYSGGELIDVYRFYRDSPQKHIDSGRNDERLSMLFLHNFEDVLGMLKLTSLLSYPLIQKSQAPVSVSLLPAEENIPDRIRASFLLDVPVPVPLALEGSDRSEGSNRSEGNEGNEGSKGNKRSDGILPPAWSVLVRENLVEVIIPFYKGCLYHFFSDYKNYYYLPEEDTALHKSVASYVDPCHRQRAKADNCYVKKQSTFLPQVMQLYQPIFMFSRKDKLSWFEWDAQHEQNPEVFSSYIHALVQAGFSDSCRRKDHEKS